MRVFIVCWEFDVVGNPLCLVDVARNENDLRAESGEAKCRLSVVNDIDVSDLRLFGNRFTAETLTTA
jgi:hypothetical protein